MMNAVQGAWLLLVPTVLIIGCQGARPGHLGVRDGRLAACPSTPNCVASQADDEVHRVAPLPFAGSPDEALARLAAIVRSLPRTTIVAQRDGYLQAEFTSLLFRFVDDVEFLADPAAGVIHVRSASRIGRSDMGVNRKRIELIRQHWNVSDTGTSPGR